ncbi:Multidrug resistance-associated protein 1, partial [Cladochytrium tenue]
AAWNYGSNVYGLAYPLAAGSGYDGEFALSAATIFPRLVSGHLAEVFNAAGLYTRSAAALVLGEEFDVLYYIGVYGLLGLLVIFVQSLSTLVFVLGSYFASTRLHLFLLRAILGAPLRFFEVTPIGRILNRFSKDMNTVDQNVMQAVDMFLSKVFMGLCILGVIGFGSWPFLIVVLPIVWIAYQVGTLYLNASRELKRLESVSRSPIYSQ